MKYRIWLLLCLLPLLWLGVRDSHDWGDDFAQYLRQTDNLLNGRPQTDNGLIYASDDAIFALKAYPVGFPLLLAPVYAKYGASIRPYHILLSVCYILLAFVLFEFFRRELSDSLSMLLTLVIAYNPYVLELKEQILSDVPFALLAIAILSAKYFPRSLSGMILLGMLCGFTASVRAIGWTIPLAFAASMWINHKKNESNAPDSSVRTRLLKSGILLLSAAVFYWILNGLIFPTGVGGFFGFYSSALGQHGIPLQQNLSFYNTLFSFLVPLPFGGWTLPRVWVLPALFILFYRLKEHNRPIEWFVLIYLLVVLFYPYRSGGFRFLLPVFPLLLFYLIRGLEAAPSRIRLLRRHHMIRWMLIVLLIGNYPALRDQIDRQEQTAHGPQEKVAMELFDYVKTTTAATDVLVFCKARAMMFYTGRRTTYLLEGRPEKDTDYQFIQTGVKYVVYPKVEPGDELYDEKLVRYMNRTGLTYEKRWENGGFIVYERAG